MLIIIVLESENKPIQSLSGEMSRYPQVNTPILIGTNIFHYRIDNLHEGEMSINEL